ncbi:hypothetical protein QYE76_060934 [Lolium multiflorum]|uniref:Transposase (putative) gypsy type domain-containing protein n=1 Tax=Lolium multiflorum TaxID=4521 RepID=A0AAD8W6R3_LOLMU|nr:hypothetical protein QYE76_060934 [Lolium multiflorum]
MATPISSAPPPFAPVHLDPIKDSGKDTEGTSANPEKASGEEQAEQKAEEIAAKKSKARQRDSEAKGKWWPCTTTETELKNLEAEGFLLPGSWRTVPGSLAPAPQDGEMVVTKALVERGFSFPPSDFFSEILKAYGLQPHNISLNSVLAISNHVTLCEGHLRDVSDPASDRKLPLFKNSPASETPAWTQCPHLSESPQLTRAVRRICKLMEEGLSGKDLTMSWFTKRIQPLQHRDRLMFHYTGRDDPMRPTKDNLFADAIDKRIRLLIKIPRELHVHVCNKDIHTNGSGTAAEAPEAPRLSKRKKAAPSSPAAKRAREAPSIAATRKLEAEKKRLKMIDTSNRAQPNIQQFFIPTGKSSGSQAPKITKKRVKPSPASIPVTPEVEVPPKASSAAKSDPKDVINIDDLPEDPTVESDKGDSGKGASSSAPPPEQPTATYTAVPTDLVDRKLRLSGATGTPQTHPHFFPVLQKVPLSQRHTEISAMMEQVWGPANTEEQELNELEGGIKAFFAKHKNVRQIEVLEAENESLNKFLKESSEEETKKKKELLEKHAQELSDLAEKLKRSQQRNQTLAAKNKDYEAEAEAIDKIIFPSLSFEWTKDATLKRTEAYEEAQSSIDNLFKACRGVAKSLSLKRAGTTVIDTMTKLIKQVPELIKDWQESSARGVASLVLATCKAHFPTMNFADVSRGAPKGTNMRALLMETQGMKMRRTSPNDFAEEGSGSSADHDEEGSGDDSGDGSAYIASDEEQSSE